MISLPIMGVTAAGWFIYEREQRWTAKQAAAAVQSTTQRASTRASAETGYPVDLRSSFAVPHASAAPAIPPLAPPPESKKVATSDAAELDEKGASSLGDTPNDVPVSLSSDWGIQWATGTLVPSDVVSGGDPSDPCNTLPTFVYEFDIEKQTITRLQALRRSKFISMLKISVNMDGGRHIGLYGEMRGKPYYFFTGKTPNELPLSRIRSVYFKVGSHLWARGIDDKGMLSDNAKMKSPRFATTRADIAGEPFAVSGHRLLIESEARSIQRTAHPTTGLLWLHYQGYTQTDSHYNLYFEFRYESLTTGIKAFFGAGNLFATTGTTLAFRFSKNTGELDDIRVISTESRVAPFSTNDRVIDRIVNLYKEDEDRSWEEKLVEEFRQRALAISESKEALRIWLNVRAKEEL